MKNSSIFPEFPLEDWLATKETLHRYLQIVGKLRLSLNSKKNHWWHLTLYVNSRGICTGPIPNEEFSFDIQFDFIHHQLQIHTSNGDSRSFELKDGLSVKDFYNKLSDILNDLSIGFEIIAKPFDLSDNVPFKECTQHNSYNPQAVHKAWQILVHVNMVLEEFSGRSYSKTCPVHIYWHHLDLVVTRFSGDRAPEMNTTSIVELEAYSHEVISFGFWFGDDNIQEPAFYSYTYPAPKDIDKEKLQPNSAKWVDANGSPMAILLYNDIREKNNAKDLIMEFLESSYKAGASLSGWDIVGLEVPVKIKNPV